MPPGPYALPFLRELRPFHTLHFEMIDGGLGLVRGRGGGTAILESLRLKLVEKGQPKTSAFSEGETAI